jgi:antitoxin component of RelBE/YafQ-DinJ toxin-antitoxin module
MEYNHILIARIDEGLFEKLKADARKIGVPVSTLVRMKLKEQYEKKD